MTTIEDRVISGTRFTILKHTLSPGQFRHIYKVNNVRASRQYYISHKLAAEQRDRDLRTTHLIPLDSLNVGACGAMGRELKLTVEIDEVTCPDCLAVHDDFCDQYR